MLGQLFRRDPVLCRRDAASAGQAPAEKASGHAAPPAPAPESAGRTAKPLPRRPEPLKIYRHAKSAPYR